MYNHGCWLFCGSIRLMLASSAAVSRCLLPLPGPSSWCPCRAPVLAPRSCLGLSRRVQGAVGSVGGGGPGPRPGRQEFLQLRALLSKPFSCHLPRGQGVWQSPASPQLSLPLGPTEPRLLPRRCQPVPSPALVLAPACAGHLFLPPSPGGSWCCPRLCLGCRCLRPLQCLLSAGAFAASEALFSGRVWITDVSAFH